MTKPAPPPPRRRQPAQPAQEGPAHALPTAPLDQERRTLADVSVFNTDDGTLNVASEIDFEPPERELPGDEP